MITLYGGKLGVGKSYSATCQVWNDIHHGKDVYVNWQIDFTKYFEKKRKSFWYRLWNPVHNYGRVFYWETLEDLYTLQNGEVYFDEAHMAIDSRDFKNLPKHFKTKLTQSRKYGLNLHFISQHTGQLDVYVKRLANEYIEYTRFWRFILWRAYDGGAIDKLANPLFPPPKTSAVGIHWFSKKFAQSYNSFALFKPFERKVFEPIWDAKKIILEQQEARRILRASKIFKKEGGDINGKGKNEINFVAGRTNRPIEVQSVSIPQRGRESTGSVANSKKIRSIGL